MVGFANTESRARQIVGRLVADHARDLSDGELERVLSPCVGGPALVQLARQMRDAGLLTCRCDPQVMQDMAACPACDLLRPQFDSF